MKRPTKLPEGWDERRVARILKHYQAQAGDAAVAEDEAAWSSEAVIRVPLDLIPQVRKLIAKRAKSAALKRTAK